MPRELITQTYSILSDALQDYVVCSELSGYISDALYEYVTSYYGRSAHYNESRYHMCNLHAAFTKGTVLSEQILYPKFTSGIGT